MTRSSATAKRSSSHSISQPGNPVLPFIALNAKARVTVNTLGPVEVMHVEATGLLPNSEFDLFVTQLPNAPFGMACASRADHRCSH
jgi:hypothetical protein